MSVCRNTLIIRIILIIRINSHYKNYTRNTLIIVIMSKNQMNQRHIDPKPAGPGSILTSRKETSSLSRVVRDGGDPFSVPLSG